jgi:monoterpene epsilon-lactone hydrolase
MADAEIEVIRGILASRPRPTDLSERRKRLDALGTQYPLPPDVRVESVDAHGVAAEWTTTPQADPTHVIMSLHGGGYISGSIDSHRHMIAQAGREARSRTLALGYRLAPEHPFPAALDDAVAGYRFLLSQGLPLVAYSQGFRSRAAAGSALALRQASGYVPGLELKPLVRD